MFEQYPFPFSETTLKRFAGPDGKNPWELYAPGWTPANREPLHLACLKEWMILSRWALQQTIANHFSKIEDPKEREHVEMFTSVMDKSLQQVEDLVELGFHTFATDPAIHRAVEENHRYSGTGTKNRPVKKPKGDNGEYPFEVPPDVLQGLPEILPNGALSGDSLCPGWSPEDGFPLHIMNVAVWAKNLQSLLHEADHRIATLDPETELHQTMTAVMEITDTSLAHLYGLCLEGAATMPYDPVVRAMCNGGEKAESGDPEGREDRFVKAQWYRRIPLFHEGDPAALVAGYPGPVFKDGIAMAATMCLHYPAPGTFKPKVC